MKDSPPSRYVRVRGDEKTLIVRTNPFYPLFFWTEAKKDNTLAGKLRNLISGSGRRIMNKDKTVSCNKVVAADDVPVINVIDDIDLNAKNTILLALVFLATILLGVLAFHYWARALGGSDNPVASFNPVLERRAVYLSVFFVFAASILSALLYELFTLKKTLTDPSESPHSFLFEKRRLVIWAFVLVWFGIVIYTTAVLSRRVEAFREQIVVNVVAGVVLLASQYFYYRANSPSVKTFSLSVSVLVVLMLVSIVYGSEN